MTPMPSRKVDVSVAVLPPSGQRLQANTLPHSDHASAAPTDGTSRTLMCTSSSARWCCQGLGNRLPGLVTAFALALLTDRVLLVDDAVGKFYGLFLPAFDCNYTRSRRGLCANTCRSGKGCQNQLPSKTAGLGRANACTLLRSACAVWSATIRSLGPAGALCSCWTTQCCGGMRNSCRERLRRRAASKE